MTTAQEACNISSSEHVGTSSTEALACNSHTLDIIVNSDELSVTNRRGNSLQTFTNIYNQIDDILANSEGVPLGGGVYAVGLEYTTRYQYLTQNNIEYRVVSTTSLPYTTTEVNASDDDNLVPFTGVSNTRLVSAIEKVLGNGASIYPKSINTVAASGDLVPTGVTHLQVNIGGSPEIVAISPATTTVAAITSITESDCLIGSTFTSFSTLESIREAEPIVILTTGQSNAAGSNTGGPNPANPKVQVWDAVTGDWGSSDYTQVPMDRNAPDGNTGRSNIGLALAHRLQKETGRLVYMVFDAVGGTSIDEWVSNGVNSTRYASIRNKIAAAFLTPELSGKTTIDAIHWQQGEEDFENTFSEYLGKFSTLITQFRAETWVSEVTPVLCGGPSQTLHDRFEPQRAQREYCNKEDAWCVWVSSAGLETEGDNTHFSGDSLWEMGYYRMYQGFASAPYLNQVDQALFYGRGVGAASPSDRQQICSASSLVSWDSKTNEFPPNSNAATGSITWGEDCDADGNYTLAGGHTVTTDNLCNYTLAWGRDIIMGSGADYCASFGQNNSVGGQHSFVTGNGNTTVDNSQNVIGNFNRYNTTQTNEVSHEMAIGTSISNRRNAVTIRKNGTVELYAPSTASDPEQNEEITFRRVNNTTLSVVMRGTDGVVRSADLTLTP